MKIKIWFLLLTCIATCKDNPQSRLSVLSDVVPYLKNGFLSTEHKFHPYTFIAGMNYALWTRSEIIHELYFVSGYEIPIQPYQHGSFILGSSGGCVDCRKKRWDECKTGFLAVVI